jgi:hypothetical protein
MEKNSGKFIEQHIKEEIVEDSFDNNEEEIVEDSLDNNEEQIVEDNENEGEGFSTPVFFFEVAKFY